jgi:N-acetylmuramoyl-L-alanine amidase
MVYNRLPDNLPEILRRKGLKVVEVPGWQNRGRPASTGEFAPVGVLNHHTATGTNWTDEAVVKLLVNGRKDLPGPLSQFGLARDATVYIIASGRCNHAGVATASGTVAAGDGNKLYIGIEAFNDGVKEQYPQVQYDAYVLLNAVLSNDITKNSVQTVRGHKETSVSGKPDPRFDMTAFRAAVAKKMKELKTIIIVEEDIVASKPGPKLKHPGTIGKSVVHKVPLSDPVAVDSAKTYTVATIDIPKGGTYIVTLQVRMPADLTSTAEADFVRLGWVDLAKGDSTGNNPIPPATKNKDVWYRWRTINHVMEGGGPVAFNIIMPKGNSKMRFVAKAVRVA